MTAKLRQPQTPEQWAAYRQFRWQQLRQPWGQPADAPDTAEEARSDHLILEDAQGQVVGCGRLLRHADGRGQVRSMAVAQSWQGQGWGQRLLERLEEFAQGRGLTGIDIHARDTALAFYQRAGYQRLRSGERLFGEIPHSWLCKDFDSERFARFGLQRHAAVDADGPAVARLVFAVLAEYGLAPERDGTDRDLDELESAYRGGFFDLLRDTEGQLVGTVAVRRIDEHSGELRRMYLAPGARGRGLGRACLGHALAWSRAAGLTHLELETATALREATRLYRWAGFTPMAGEREARRCDQRLVLKDF